MSDTAQWRRKVDKRLGSLETRMTTMETTQASANMDINRKLDKLIMDTSSMLLLFHRVGVVRKTICWVAQLLRRIFMQLGVIGTSLLSFLTFLWVWEHSHTLMDAWEQFIMVFNGTTR